jgi:hypothetical protein
MKRPLLIFLTLLLFVGTLAAQAKKPEPAPLAPAAEEDATFFVIHSQGKWVGWEAIVVTKENPEGQLLLKYLYECQLTGEAGMGYTSARGECRFVADTLALVDGTLTKFNDDVTLVDVKLKREKNKLTTSALGTDTGSKQANISPDSKLAAPWMAEKMIMASQSFDRGAKIPYIEFTGDLGRANATREVSISIIANQERTIHGNPISGWQAEMLYTNDPKATPVQLFLDVRGRIMEKVQGETVFTRVATREETQLAKTYEFMHRGRRDPFATRLTVREKGAGKRPDGDGGKTTQPPKDVMTEAEAAKHVADAEAFLAEMKGLVDKIKDKKELNEKYGQLFQLITAKKEHLAPTKHEQHKKRIAEIEQEAKIVMGRDGLIAQARAILGMANMRFDSEQYDKIGEQKKKLEEMLASAEVRQDPNLEKEIKGYVVEAAKLIQRGLIRLDFAAKKLRVTGIVYTGQNIYENVCFTVNILGKALTTQTRLVKWLSESVAVVSVGAVEEEVHEGSQVSIIKDSKTFVQRIDPGAVIFLFEGESIRVPKSW